MTISKQTNHEIGNVGTRSGLFYFLAGGCIGAATALLLAPKAGTELRGEISEAARKGYDETVELAHRLKERSDNLYKTLREKAEGAYDVASTKISLAKERLDDTFESAEYTIENAATSKGAKVKSNTPPSNIY